MSTTAEPLKKRKYHLDDSRLTLLVSQAAMELDQAAHGQNHSLAQARKFFEFLRESLHADTSLTRDRWLDPETVNLFEHTLRDVGTQSELRTVQDVVNEALRYVRSFDDTESDSTQRNLRSLLDFSIAFGNSLLAHRAQTRPQLPAHPYRR